MDLNVEAAILHDSVRVSALLERKFQPEEFWEVVLPLIRSAPHLSLEEIGRSALGRPLRLARFGAGPIGVLIWSQMHGDEPTATMAIADLIRYLAEHADDERVGRWSEALTILLVPIVNPDGTAHVQRRNAQGIDINRDAVRFRTPELKALDAARERHRPDFALPLHDEEAKTRVGKSERMSAISLLAPPADPSLGENPARLKAKGLCTRIHEAIRPLVGEHVARYEANYDPAIVDVYFQQRGISTVLVETGWWPEDVELQFLRKVNFAVLLAALDSIASGSYEPVRLDDYDGIPENDRAVFDVMIRGGSVVIPGVEPFMSDVGLNFEESLDLANGHIADVGDLSGYSARDILIAEGLFIHVHEEALASGPEGYVLKMGAPGSLTVRKGAGPESEAVWVMERAVTRRADGPQGEPGQRRAATTDRPVIPAPRSYPRSASTP